MLPWLEQEAMRHLHRLLHMPVHPPVLLLLSNTTRPIHSMLGSRLLPQGGTGGTGSSWRL